MVQIVLHAKAVVGWTRLGYALRRVLQQPDVQGDEALTLQLLLFRQISVAPFVSRRCGTCGATMMIIILVVTAVGRRRCNSVLLEARLAARVAVRGGGYCSAGSAFFSVQRSHGCFVVQVLQLLRV